MPENSKDSYKEMYEMGERLMQMAKDGGYSPEDADYSDSEDTEESSMAGQANPDKVKAALGMFSNG